jgi:hypothetical protein
MIIINQWEQLLGKTICEARRSVDYSKIELFLDSHAYLFRLESCNPRLTVNIYNTILDHDDFNPREMHSLVGKKVSGAIVPFVLDGHGLDGGIKLVFDDSDFVIVYAEILSTPLRIA